MSATCACFARKIAAGEGSWHHRKARFCPSLWAERWLRRTMSAGALDQRSDGGDKALQVLRFGLAMVAVLDQSKLDIGACQQIDQGNRMAPVNVRVAHALQNAHRTAGIEGMARKQMDASLFDDMPGDGVRVAIGR